MGSEGGKAERPKTAATVATDDECKVFTFILRVATHWLQGATAATTTVAMAEVGPRSAEVATVGPIEATSNTRSGSSGILPRLESGEGGKWAGFDSRRPGQIERRNSGQRIARRFSAIIGSRSVTSRDRRAPSPPRSINAHMKLPIAEGVWTAARPMRGFGMR